MFLSDNRCSFTTKHSLDEMTSTWIHIVSWIPYILLMFQFWYCLLSWRKVAKFRAKIYSISDFWNREKCNICDISSWLGISKFNNGVFGFGFCEKGWYKNNCWKATILLNPDIFHKICEKFQTKFYYKKLISNFYSEFYLPQIH